MPEVFNRLNQIRYGDVKEGADLGAMITEADRDEIVKQIEKLETERIAEMFYEKAITRGCGYDFPPTVLKFSGWSSYAKKAPIIMNTELFGPVSTIITFKDIDKVEDMCRLTDFALTGSVFTRDLEMLQRVLNFIPAGNVYWNRKCTGALVEVECFGGLRSASSPNGIKGKGAMFLFGSQPTFSGFYPKDATSAYKRMASKMLKEIGFGLSKS